MRSDLTTFQRPGSGLVEGCQEYTRTVGKDGRLDRSLLVAEEEEIRTLLGTEQASPAVGRAILTKVPIADGTLFKAPFLVAHVTNTTFHWRHLTNGRSR
jgi:hypothetical protein